MTIRYRCGIVWPGLSNPMLPDPNGGYVFYRDYEKLEEELEYQKECRFQASEAHVITMSKLQELEAKYDKLVDHQQKFMLSEYNWQSDGK